MKKGSVTVFLSLVMVLVMSFLFSMLEGARIYCLKDKAQLLTDICMQSMFGNYHEGLWSDYHLLFLDGSWQEEEFLLDKFIWRAMEETKENLGYAEEYLQEGLWELTGLTLQNIRVDCYELATDSEGEAFGQQVRQQMQIEATQAALEELLQLQDQEADLTEYQEQKEGRWEQAWEAIEEAERVEEAQGSEEPYIESEESHVESEEQYVESEEQPEERENPMEYVKEIKNYSMLSLVLPDATRISSKVVTNGNSLEERVLQEGNWQNGQDTNAMDRLWLQYYIQNYFSDYTRDSEKGAEEQTLDYEIEYLIGGSPEDGENLERVVSELLGMREALNFATIMRDASKKQQALAIATAAVGWTGVMPLVKAVQIGVMLAWSFIESVMDVRSLLAGKRIPFMKATNQWSSDLTNCRENINSGVEAQDEKDGLSYTQYLQILLFLRSEKTLRYRCMDLIEQNENVRMDDMIAAIEPIFVYEAKPLFWRFNFLSTQSWEGYNFQVSTVMSYGVE